MGNVNRRDFLKLSALGLALAAGARWWLGSRQQSGTIGTRDEMGVHTLEPLPYLPDAERINPEIPIPSDVISPEDLWRSYHTRIWNGKDTKMYLRPGIETILLFQDLADRKLESLDIVLFDDMADLSMQQRGELPEDLVLAFDEEYKRSGGFPTGELLGTSKGHMGIFIAKSSVEHNDKHLLESYPPVENDFIAVWHTPAIIFRHECEHYNYYNFNNSPEEMVGMDILEDMLEAEKLYKNGDDSGYYVVYEIKEGVVVS